MIRRNKEMLKLVREDCPVCGGNGTMECKHCGGSGKIYHTNYPLQSGTATNYTYCTNCNGTGITRCSQCSGNGYVGVYREVD